MSEFFENTMQGLLEAIAIEKGVLPLEKKENMPISIYTVPERDAELIDEAISIRKTQKISQNKLAELTGNRQQAISRIENREHSPSLKTFCNIVHALGYDLKIVKM